VCLFSDSDRAYRLRFLCGMVASSFLPNIHLETVKFSLLSQHKIPFQTVILRVVLVPATRIEKTKKEVRHMRYRTILVKISGRCCSTQRLRIWQRDNRVRSREQRWPEIFAREAARPLNRDREQ
jgi:hypothetical protein